MEFKYLKVDEATKSWTDAKGTRWAYTTKKPANFIADIRKKSKLKAENFLVTHEAMGNLEPVKQKLGLYEKVRGYIACEDNAGQLCWVRIVESSRPKICLTLLLILALLGFGAGYVINLKKPVDDTPIKIKANQLANPNPENIRLPGIEKIYANQGDPDVTQLLLNVKGNAVKFQYIITLSETGEVLYKSKLINPGYGIKKFTMSRTFKKGKYPISILVKSTALDSGKKKEQKVAYNAGQLNATLVVR